MNNMAKTLRAALAAALLAAGATSAARAQTGRSGKATRGRHPPAAAAKAPRGKGVRALFDYAESLYDAGKYEKALAAFDVLLRKFPGHEPAIIQTAKSLYRLDRIKEAYNVFARIDPQHLDPETGYEYGWSFYTMKQWQGALGAFQRIPKGHALFDLANYYGAICAIKLRKYDDADDMLEKAVVLPDKLAKSRSLYSKHVQALRLMQQKSALAKERDQEKDALREANRKKSAIAGDKEKDKAPVGPYVHAGKRAITKSAKVKYALTHQYIDDKGLAETTSDVRTSTFELKSGPLLPLPAIRLGKDRAAAFGLQLRLAAEDVITKGTQQRILINESNEDLQRLAIKDLGVTDLKDGQVGAEPWIEFPLPENAWVALGGEVAFTYPDFGRGERTGTRRGYAQLAGTAQALNYSSEVSYKEVLDEKTKPTTTVVGGFVGIDGEIAAKLTTSLTITHEIYDYLVDVPAPDVLPIDGPDSLTRAESEIIQSMPFGFSLGVLGAYEVQTNDVFHRIPTFGQVAADGQVVTGKISLKATPVPWLSVAAVQTFQKKKWQLQNEAARDAFELNVPDYIENFTGTVSVNMDF